MDKKFKIILLIYLTFVVPFFYIKTIEIIYITLLGVLFSIYLLKNNYKLVTLIKTPMKYYLIFLFISLISEITLLLTNYEVFMMFFTGYFRIWIYFVLMLFVLTVSKEENFFEELVSAIILSSFIPNIIGLLQFKFNIFTIIHSLEGQTRLGSTFSHPNFYGYYLVIVIICLLYKKDSITNGSKRYFINLYFTINLILLIFTHTRTTLIVLLIILLFRLFRYAFSKNKLFTISVLIFSTLLLIITLFFLLNSNIFLTSRFNVSANSGSFSWRIGRWKSAIGYWVKSMEYILFGCGWLTSREFTIEPGYRTFNMHNEFLRLIFDTGILGFIAYATFFVKIIAKTIKFHLNKEKMNLLCSLTILLVVACSDDNLLIVPENCIYIILLYTAIYALGYWKSINGGEDKQ